MDDRLHIVTSRRGLDADRQQRAWLVVCTAVALILAFAGACHAASPPITAIAFSPDGRTVATGSQEGVVVYPWPGLNRKTSIESEVEHVHDLKFSPDGKRLAIAGGVPAESGSVEIIAWPSARAVSICRGHSDVVMGIGWIGRETLATASLDHTIGVWDVPRGERRMRLEGHSRGVTDVVHFENQLTSAGLDGSIRVWSLESGKVIRTLNQHTGPIRNLALRPAEGLPVVASVAADQTLRLWQPTIGRMVRFTRLMADPLDVAWHLDGAHLFASSREGDVWIVDVNTAEVKRKLSGIQGWAYAIQMHPSDGSLLVAGERGQLRRFDLVANSKVIDREEIRARSPDR